MDKWLERALTVSACLLALTLAAFIIYMMVAHA